MRQQIGDVKYGICRVFAYTYLFFRAVAKHYDSVKRKRNRRPLILFDTAVIVRFKQRHFAAFVKRILLYIEARRVDMSDYHSYARLVKVAFSDFENRHRFIFIDVIIIAADGEFVAAFIFLIAAFFRFVNGKPDAFAFGFASVEKLFISLGEVENLLLFGVFHIRKKVFLVVTKLLCKLFCVAFHIFTPVFRCYRHP